MPPPVPCAGLPRVMVINLAGHRFVTARAVAGRNRHRRLARAVSCVNPRPRVERLAWTTRVVRPIIIVRVGRVCRNVFRAARAQRPISVTAIIAKMVFAVQPASAVVAKVRIAMTATSVRPMCAEQRSFVRIPTT